jgi:peptidase M23-like protein
VPKTITRLALLFIACLAVSGAAPAAPRSAGVTEPPVLAFYPQAGVPWQDLYFGNFVDLDPGPGVLDWSCGSQTYDGHTGEDSLIRSFREKRIGVPVFAALDGVVVDIQAGLPDEHVETTMTPVDNHVVIASLGRHIRTVYGHLRRKVMVRLGQHVRAGRQIGWTASSGHSSWPHLHFTSQLDFQVYESFAGPCRPGPSYWREQPALPAAPYVQDFTFSRKAFGGRRDPPWDTAVRTGSFGLGLRDVYFRVELSFFDGSPMHVTVVRPDGSVALDVVEATRLEGSRGTWASWHERIDLDRLGTWRLRLAANGQVLVDAPFDVVAPGQARNRPPNAVTLSLDPSDPSSADVVQCVVRTSLVTEDPDYDIVPYRYRWRVDGRLVRKVTSAALSDVLRHGLARPGQRLSCRVTPSDGRRRGPSASASVTVR